MAITLTRKQVESFILLGSLTEVPSVCVVSRYTQNIQPKLLTLSATSGIFLLTFAVY
jgi:hypothetical protein